MIWVGTYLNLNQKQTHLQVPWVQVQIQYGANLNQTRFNPLITLLDIDQIKAQLNCLWIGVQLMCGQVLIQPKPGPTACGY